MQTELQFLITTAVTVACLHTLAGPDHYIPFIALAKIRSWSIGKALLWTAVCGLGHVISSVVLGLLLTGLGWTLTKMVHLEEIRGGIAGWALLGFGLVYGCWGWLNAYRDRSHKHFDVEEDGSLYVFQHNHVGPYRSNRYPVTPWVMFIIFVLGPCEPMIPLLALPAVQSSWEGMLILILVYSTFTLMMMMTAVAFGYYGISLFKTEKMERYTHALGGLSIFICGAGMVFFGW